MTWTWQWTSLTRFATETSERRQTKNALEWRKTADAALAILLKDFSGQSTKLSSFSNPAPERSAFMKQTMRSWKAPPAESFLRSGKVQRQVSNICFNADLLQAARPERSGSSADKAAVLVTDI